MILLYANPIETELIDYYNKRYIGYKARYLSEVEPYIANSDKVVLFGASGLLQDYCPNFDDYDAKEEDCEKSLYDFYAPRVWESYRDEPIAKADAEFAGISKAGVGYTNSCSVKEKEIRQLIVRNYNAIVVDMESWFVGRMCNDYNVPFISVRYIIDRCDRRCKPFGFNHFWRKKQHRIMQKRFELLICK
jgi:hypothetical protein